LNVMATLTAPIPQAAPITMADLLEQLGDIPPFRVRLRPPPGEATESDVLALHDHEHRLFELVDGVLVEKAMGFRESILAAALIRFLAAFVQDRNLGVVAGSDGMMRLFPKTVRMPDVAYVSWARFPAGHVTATPIPDLSPDLAVEVLSASNTPAEMLRKRGEYFRAGTRLVWIIDADARTISVFTSAGEELLLGEKDQLSGGVVLPGFVLPIADLFAKLDQRQH